MSGPKNLLELVEQKVIMHLNMELIKMKKEMKELKSKLAHIEEKILKPNICGMCEKVLNVRGGYNHEWCRMCDYIICESCSDFHWNNKQKCCQNCELKEIYINIKEENSCDLTKKQSNDLNMILSFD